MLKLLIVSILLWSRWLISSLPGYIHPDEFFQNPEMTSSRIFGIETFTPWEYTPEHASRSVIAPFITTGIPFWILKSWTPEGTLPSSYRLFLAERLGSFLVSLIIDLCVYRLCKCTGTKPTIPMILVATSQVTLAYYTRPFSNSFESVLLCLSLCTYAEYANEATSKRSFLLGALFSLGVFTRITFPLYAFPIGVAYLYQAYKKNNRFNGFTSSVFPFVIGLVAFSVFSIVADSVYYETLTLTVHGEPFTGVGHVISTLFNPLALASMRPEGEIVITPINNLLYNLNLDNLAQHGVHPRYTHFAINLPLLYGPLVIFGFLYIPHAFTKVRNDENGHLLYVFVSVVLNGLIGLSIMPHQEARFLCPLLVPLVMIFTFKQPKLSRTFWANWILFNVITTYIFGVIHQGGLIPAMDLLYHQTSGLRDCRVLKNGDLTCASSADLNKDLNGFKVTTNLVFYKTYMPPRHLLVIPKGNKNNHVNVLDFSSDLDKVVEQLGKSSGVILRRHQAGKPEIDFAKTDIPNAYERTVFIAPSFVSLPKISQHRYLLMASYTPHISFDDIDQMMERVSETHSPESQMNLNVFLILSEKDDTL